MPTATARFVQACRIWQQYVSSRFLARYGARMAGCDGGLQRVWPRCVGKSFRTFQRRQPSADKQVLPVQMVLIEQQHRAPRCSDLRHSFIQTLAALA